MKSLKKESRNYYLLFNLPLQILCLFSLFYVNNFLIFTFVFLTSYILIYWAGVQAGFHKLFAHKNWEPKNSLIKYIFAWLGCYGLMGGPIIWSQIHRHHHIYSDTVHDPHTPMKGKLYAYFLWLLDVPEFKLITIKDLLKDKILLSINKYCKSIVLITLVIFAVLNFNVFAGFLFACVLTFHSEMLVNAVLHKQQGDNFSAANNTFLSFFSGGSSLHKNHHDNIKLNNFAIKKYEFDCSYFFIKLFQAK